MKFSLSRLLAIGGALVAVIGLVFMVWLYWPVLIAEYQYRFIWSNLPVPAVTVFQAGQSGAQKNEITPINLESSITIPKLWISAPLIMNVNPLDSRMYQRALRDGVAHATGSAKPGEAGTSFIFAHSSANQLIAQRYNAVFYLLNKMEKDDEIVIYYQNKPYRYLVTKIEVVRPDQIASMNINTGPQKLVLMTCTPAGTTLQRLLVHADLKVTEPLPADSPVVN